MSELLRIEHVLGCRCFSALLATCLALAIAAPRSSCQVDHAVSPHRSGSSREHNRQLQYGTHRAGDELNLYSEQRENRLGGTLAHEIESTIRVLADPVVDDYLTRISERLAFSSGIHLPSTIRVVLDPEINAYSVPGHVYLDSGLILAVENEGELAGVLAHELGHLVSRYTTRNLTRRQLGLPLRSFQRNCEFQADQLAVRYVYSSGYDPIAFAEFLDRVFSQSSRRTHFIGAKQTFEIYPTAKDRTRRIRHTVLRSLPRRARYAVDSTELQEIQLRLLIRVQQEALRQQNGASPSGVESVDTDRPPRPR